MSDVVAAVVAVSIIPSSSSGVVVTDAEEVLVIVAAVVCLLHVSVDIISFLLFCRERVAYLDRGISSSTSFEGRELEDIIRNVV